MSRCRHVEILVQCSPLRHEVWICAGSVSARGPCCAVFISCLCSMIPMDVFFVQNACTGCRMSQVEVVSRDLAMGTPRIPSPSSRLPLLSSLPRAVFLNAKRVSCSSHGGVAITPFTINPLSVIGRFIFWIPRPLAPPSPPPYPPPSRHRRRNSTAMSKLWLPRGLSRPVRRPVRRSRASLDRRRTFATVGAESR